MEKTKCCGRPIFDEEKDVPQSYHQSGNYVLRKYYDDTSEQCDSCEQYNRTHKQED